MLSKLLIAKHIKPVAGGVLQQGEKSGAGEGNRSIEDNHSLTICFIKNHESFWLQ